MLGRTDDLIVLMTFACDQHCVTRRCERERFANRATPIRLNAETTFIALHACNDVLDDSLRIFRARIVRRDHCMIGRERRLAHKRAFGRIAITATTEHDDGLALRELFDRCDSLLECIGRMRVIDIHRQTARTLSSFTWRKLDALDTPRHRRDICQCASNIVRCIPKLERDAECAHHVLNIEAPDQRIFERDNIPHHTKHHARTRRIVGDLDRMDIRILSKTCCDDRVALFENARKQALSPFATDIDDALGRIIRAEQTPLCRKIRLEGLVVIKMILRQIRERCHCKIAPPHAIEVKCVRADLHSHNATMCISHLCEDALQIAR